MLRPGPPPSPTRVHVIGLMAGLALGLVVGTSAGLVVGSSAMAADDGRIHLRYATYWGGLHAADFTLDLPDLESTHTGSFDHAFVLRTRGIIDWLIRLQLKAESSGAFAKNPGDNASLTQPDAYRIHYTSRRRERSMKIELAPPGPDQSPAQVTIHTLSETDEAKRQNMEKSDRKEEQDVSPNMRIGVIDPLTAFIESLYRARRHVLGGKREFTLHAFDGARRFDVNGQFIGKRTRIIADTKHETYHLRLTTRPIAGFRRSQKAMWDGAVFDIDLSRDGRFIPLKIDSVPIGPVMRMIEECETTCQMPEEE